MFLISKSNFNRANQILIALVICIASSGFSVVANTNSPQNLDAQRKQFKDARKALGKRQITRFRRLSETLKDYPLHYYLRYKYLSPRIYKTPPSELQAFVDRYKSAPLAEDLRRRWLVHLAKTRRWQDFLAVYTPQTATDLKCFRLLAELRTNQARANFQDEVIALWLTGKSQPNACNPVFQHLQQQGILNDEQYWQRIHLAMYRDNVSLASHLGRRLKNAKLKEYLRYWQRMQANPRRELKRLNLKDTAQGREIMRYGLEKLAETSATQAHREWVRLQSRYTFTIQDSGTIRRAIALGAAEQRHVNAAQWLAEIPATHISESVNTARLKLAWEQLDWAAVQAVLFNYPESLQHNAEWQYWLARAMEQQGDQLTALKLFSAAAENREYYGFLAADRLRVEYNIQHQPIPISDAEARQLIAKYPAIDRAKEFYEVGMVASARREWDGLLEVMSNREASMAARVAKCWRWYDRAIITAAKAEAYNDLDVRFPIPHHQTIMDYAYERELEQAWIYGVMRQESAFMNSVYSHAGAMGLMQLMPSTGRYLARKAKLRLRNTRQLMEVDTNIKLGTLYLRELLDTFQGSYALATAGYNAGPGRAQRWHRKRACLPDDVWVELIPFDETRDYVKKVLTYTAIFHNRLGEPIRPLAETMRRPASCRTAQAQHHTGGAD